MTIIKSGEDEIYNEDGSRHILLFDDNNAIWFDFYMDDEEGNTVDDGNSFYLLPEEYLTLDRPLTHESLVQTRNWVLTDGGLSGIMEGKGENDD